MSSKTRSWWCEKAAIEDAMNKVGRPGAFVSKYCVVCDFEHLQWEDATEEKHMEYRTKDSGERAHFESGMQRDVTSGKTRYALIADGPMLKRYAELMTRGAEKYEARNWLKANSEQELERFRDSAFRHFMQWFLGDTDEDHAAAVWFNINGAEYVKDKLRGL